MTSAYWKQWDYNYLLSLQGIDIDHDVDDEPEFDHQEKEEKCPYCTHGCNYCLMLNP